MSDQNLFYSINGTAYISGKDSLKNECKTVKISGQKNTLPCIFFVNSMVQHRK